MENLINLPTPEELQHRINLCRAELDALKRALRAALAMRKAEEARGSRERSPNPNHQPDEEGPDDG